MIPLPASVDDLTAVAGLLKKCGLPHADLTPGHMREFLVIPAEGELAACAGLEIFGSDALLRSLAVHAPLRLQGVGRLLCGQLEQRARENGVNTLYLLTTDAEAFFAKRGYQSCTRDEVPVAVKASAEFTALCPTSCPCMRKKLT